MISLVSSLLVALPLASAIPLSSGDASASSQGGVISVPFHKAVGPAGASSSGSRRLQRLADRARDKGGLNAVAAAVPPPHQDLIDRSEYYLADLGIGTPPQPISLLVDTGGWITWVNPDCSQAARMDECNGLPQYDPTASNNPTPRHVHGLDQIVYYGDTMAASLQGYADVFTWGGLSTGNASAANATAGQTKVPLQPFGVANRTVGVSTGILSLGPDGRDGFDSQVSNYSVVATMAQQGIIASRVFSLTFSRIVEIGKHAGLLVFGGLDKNRFTGPLVKTPIIPFSPDVDAWRYWVSVTEVAHHRADGTLGAHNATSGFNGTFLVDSGTEGIYVPRDIYDSIIAEMNLTRSSRPEGFPDVDCSLRDVKGSFSFTFAGKPLGNGTAGTNSTAPGITISVPYASLVHPPQLNTTAQCFFTLSSGGAAYDDGDIYPILGVEFLKAAYVTFDWDNREIAFAQGANCGAPDLVPIGKGPDAIPSVRGNCKSA